MKRTLQSLCAASALLLVAAFSARTLGAEGAAQTAAKAPVVSFSSDIRPILAVNCFPCHGQDPTTRQANLRLDIREGALAARPDGRAVEPGHPERSALVARINAANSPLLMPPPSSNHRLTLRERDLLANWVRQGAPYEIHWAFRRLKRPPPPAVANRAWIRNPIDAFVLARLEKVGLKPSPEADRMTLIRRVALDLTGLPPTPAEADAFQKDPAPNAYEKVVDRLLASPHFGENWARMWLDLARYADTQGYEKDPARTMWRYRDWVIAAFNADMPYDRFTIEQIAGDLLPHPTDSQLLATAFNRNTMTNTEGGVDAEEFRVAAVKDRVDTTVQVWMGLTMGCAKCHSHKYDPITQQDYYRFYALFNQSMDANRDDEYPTAPMPTDDQKRRATMLDAKLKGLREAFQQETPGRKERQAAWEQDLAAHPLWTVLRLASATSEGGATLTPREDGTVLASGPHPKTDTYALTFPLPAGRLNSLRIEVLKDPALPGGGPGREPSDPNVVLSEIAVEFFLPGATHGTPVPLQGARADFEQDGWPVREAIDGNPDTGWAFAPRTREPHVAVFDFRTPFDAAGQLKVTLRQNHPLGLQLGCFRISVSSADTGLLKAELRPVSDLAAILPAKRTAEEQKRLDEAFRQTADPTAAAVYKDLAVAEKERAAIETETPVIPIMRDLPKEKQRVTLLQQRGNFLDPGEPVSADVPAAFGPLPADAPHDRLGAARWLVAHANALTPRVAVNRIWARLFGVGLVETEEDFGTQGTPPTHPELLDWLASTFRDNLGWSTKRLCKTIVMSAAYRQSSAMTPERRRADPRNLLLSRGPRFRLSAEAIRDGALAVSGLLSNRLYGPPVMPPQPDGIWHIVSSSMRWQTSTGEDRYRRALYTFWRRSSPYPSMTTFDAGSGEYCIVRRVRTNTPLQALVTLNDPAFVEAAGALGRMMLTSPARDARGRVLYGFRRVLIRRPAEAEMLRLLRLYSREFASFHHKPEAAQALMRAAGAVPLPGRDPAEQAACTLVANVLLNLDEALTKP